MAEVLGVLGFVLASVSLIWQIWTYRNEQKEKIHAGVPSYGFDGVSRDGFLTVSVVNTGRTATYISGVTLWYLGRDRRRSGDGLLSETDPASPLLPHQARDYLLRILPDDHLREILDTPVDELYISVESHMREVARLKDRPVRAILIALQQHRTTLVARVQ